MMVDTPEEIGINELLGIDVNYEQDSENIKCEMTTTFNGTPMKVSMSTPLDDNRSPEVAAGILNHIELETFGNLVSEMYKTIPAEYISDKIQETNGSESLILHGISNISVDGGFINNVANLKINNLEIMINSILEFKNKN